MGVTARVDATVGIFRAPAGVIAGIANAVGVQTKFTDTELGDLNASNINVIRSVPGAGICVMGARTRKAIGVDRYVSARRTLDLHQGSAEALDPVRRLREQRPAPVVVR